MKGKILSSAIAISVLFLLPAFAAMPVTAAAAPTTGLYGAYWLGSFWGSPAPTWPACPTSSTPVPPPPAGVPSSTPPTVTETDASINFGSTTGFYWDESYAVSGAPTPGPPGNPGGFAVTQGGYNVALTSWGDPHLYTDYPTSTYFVDTDFSVEWTGYIWLTSGTTYYFTLTSDDGSWLYLNTTPGSSTISGANLIVNDAGAHGPSGVTSSGITVPTTGNYAIEVDYFETCDTQSGIDLSWTTTPSAAPTIIPTTAFTPAAIASNAPLEHGIPQFGIAAPLVAAIGLLAVVFTRRKSFLRTATV